MVWRLDYHNHTKLCRHAIGSMEDYVQVALTKQLDEIGFADHFIMIYMPPSTVQEDYCMKEEEVPVYVESVNALQEMHEDIIIKLGIEVDYYQGKENVIKKLLAPYKFDYIYGSTHVVNDQVIDDGRFRKKPQGHEIFQQYRDYFSLLKKAIESGLIDIVAHFDLPKKYGDRPQEPITELVNEVIETLANSKVCIELNTGGFRKPVKEQYPSNDILKICCEHDIQVTLGSDSHRPSEVGWEIDRALGILREVGYSQIVGFVNRKKVFFEI